AAPCDATNPPPPGSPRPRGLPSGCRCDHVARPGPPAAPLVLAAAGPPRPGRRGPRLPPRTVPAHARRSLLLAAGAVSLGGCAAADRPRRSPAALLPRPQGLGGRLGRLARRPPRPV